MNGRQRSRRGFLRGLAAAAAAVALPARAQQPFPGKPIRLISPWTAGGTSDVVLRALAQSAAKSLNGTIVVDNKPGAGGTLGASELVHAQPDGYTLSQLTLSVLTLPHMQKVSFDPLRDITYIARLAVYTNGLVVRADSAFQSVADVVAYAKANPERFTYASPGVASSPHMAMEEFAYGAGIRLLHIPYKGDSDGLAALLSGNVMAVSGATSWGPQVDAGVCRLLAVYSSKRAKRWPGGPTMQELGYRLPDIPFGIGGPKGMSAAVVSRLQEGFRAALEDPAAQATLDKYDMTSAYLGSEAFTRTCHDAFATQRAAIQRLGLAGRG
jgi:tripartite-type tricarboxylate transporter receptor subunit TctC